MTINYTSLLKLAKPVTGTESGTWGDTVNDAITSPLDVAVAGAVSIDVTSGNVTLSNNDGSGSNQARYAILLVIGTPGVSRNIIGPGTSKIYLVKNSSNGEIVVKASATTGVTIPVNTEASVFWNGSDYEIVGMQGPSSSTDNAVVRFDGTTGKVVQNSVVTIADSTGDVAGVGALTMGGNLTLSGGTANGVLYLNGSKVATSGSALTFDGTNFGIGTSSPSFNLDIGNTSATSNFTQRIVSGASYAATARYDLSGTGTFTVGFNNSGSVVNNAPSGAASLWMQQNYPLVFGTNGSERMRLDSSGNLGLGVTPSAWRSSERALQIGGVTALTNITNFSILRNNNYVDSAGTERYLTTAAAGALVMVDGQYRWLTAPSGTAGAAISFTQALTLDASGQLSVGTTAVNTAGAGYQAFTINGANGSNIALNGGATNIGLIYAATGNSSLYVTNQTASGPLIFGAGSGNERARITSGGDLLVGTTSAGSLNGRAVVAGASGISSIGTLSTSGTGASDTGISINQGNGGGCIVLVASRNTSNATNTDAAVYIVRFYFDGNNAPTTVYVGGSANFVTFGVSGSNTLTLTNSVGGNVFYSWFGNK